MSAPCVQSFADICVYKPTFGAQSVKVLTSTLHVKLDAIHKRKMIDFAEPDFLPRGKLVNHHPLLAHRMLPEKAQQTHLYRFGHFSEEFLEHFWL